MKNYYNKFIFSAFICLTLLFSAGKVFADIEGMQPTVSQFPIIKGQLPSLYTGDLNLSFDLMSVPGRSGLNFDIKLDYNSGIKVEDEASWVGLGWNLAIPSIARSIDNEPDDGPTGWMNKDTCSGPDDDCDYNHQDKFFLNIGGGFEKIIIANDGKAYTHSWKPWRIEFDQNTSDGIDWWKVTKDDGTVFEFNLSSQVEITTTNKSFINTTYAPYQVCEDIGHCSITGESCTPGSCNDILENNGPCLGICSQSGTACQTSFDCPNGFYESCNYKQCQQGSLYQTCVTDYDCEEWSPQTCYITQQCNWIYPQTDFDEAVDTKTHSYRNNWFLSAIKSPDYIDRTGDGPTKDDFGSYIKFNYEKETSNAFYNYPSTGDYLWVSRSLTSGFTFNNETTYESTASHYYKSSTDLEMYYLKSIESPVSYAVFHRTSRADLKDANNNFPAKRLWLIELFLGSEPTSQVAKAVHFDNTGYELAKGAPGNSAGQGKLTLTSITEYGKYNGVFNVSNPHLNPTVFRYGFNPDYHMWAKDYWGYYNGQTGNSGNLNTDVLTPNYHAKAWSLAGVDYPSGGKINYVYEMDSFIHVQDARLDSLNYGGGIRVKSMESCDGLNPCALTHFFYRENDDGSGDTSGVALVKPDRAFVNPGEDSGYIISRDAFLFLGAHEETQVNYSKVIEKPGYLGKKVTEFFTAKDDGLQDEDFNKYGKPFTYNDWKRGQIKSSKVYSEGAVLPIKEEYFTYTRNLNLNYRYFDVDDGSNIPEHKIVSGWTTLDVRTESTEGVSKQTQYFYHAANGRSNLTIESSGTERKVTQVDFCQDVWACYYNGSSGKVGETISARNILGLPSKIFVKPQEDSQEVYNVNTFTYMVKNESEQDPAKRRLYQKGTCSWLDKDFDMIPESSSIDAYICEYNGDFDDWGNLLFKTDLNGALTETEYVPLTSRIIKEKVTADGKEFINEILSYDPVFITIPRSIKSDSGIITTFTYDDFGRLKTTQSSSGLLTTVNYFPVDGAITSSNLNMIETIVEMFTPPGVGARISADYFDGFGNKVVSRVESPEGSVLTHSIFDKWSRATVASVPFLSSYPISAGNLEGNDYSFSVYENNPLSRVHEAYPNKVKMPDLKTVKTYSSENNQFYRTVTTDAMGYDSISKATPLGSKTYGYREKPNGSLLKISEITKDVLGNVLEKMDAQNNITRYFYDSMGRKIAELNPDMDSFWPKTHIGLIDSINGQETMVTTEWVYDSAGNAVLYRDSNMANSQEPKHMGMSFDDLGREISRGIYKDTDNSLIAGSLIKNHYDNYSITGLPADFTTVPSISDLGQMTFWQDRAKGKQTAAVSDKQLTIFFFDDFGNVAEKKIRIENKDFVFEYDYNEAGELIRETIDPVNNVKAQYSYDIRGNIESVDLIKDQLLLVDNILVFKYEPDGKISRIERSNGQNTDYGFDELRRLNLINNYHFKRFFKYDPLGRITRIFNDTGDTDPQKLIGNFDLYDHMGRLKSATITSALTSKSRGIEFDYDNVGNRLFRGEYNVLNGSQAVGDENFIYQSGSNRLVQIRDNIARTHRDISYDHNGNILEMDQKSALTTTEVQISPLHDGYILKRGASCGNQAISGSATIKTGFLDESSSGCVFERYMSFIKFNVADIPLEEIISAKLRLYLTGSDNNQIYPDLSLKMLVQDYGTLEATDDEIPADEIALVSGSSLTSPSFVEVDITSAIKVGVNAFELNTDLGNIYQFAASENSDQNLRPKLVITKVSSWDVNLFRSFTYDDYGNATQVVYDNDKTELYGYNSAGKRIIREDSKGFRTEYIYSGNGVIFDSKSGNFKRGDLNDDGYVNILDIVKLVNFKFRNGPAPEPVELADVNGDDVVNVLDAIYLVNYKYKNGPAPIENEPIVLNTAYLTVNGMRLLSISQGKVENIRFFLNDQIGSSGAVFDMADNIIGRQEYYPFGKTFHQVGNTSKYQFTGKENDGETGLYYYGARYYDPALGRFMQRDTVDDGPSPYVYTHNNPLIMNDPSGHSGDYEWQQLGYMSTNPDDYGGGALGWLSAAAGSIDNAAIHVLNGALAVSQLPDYFLHELGWSENDRENLYGATMMLGGLYGSYINATKFVTLKSVGDFSLESSIATHRAHSFLSTNPVPISTKGSLVDVYKFSEKWALKVEKYENTPLELWHKQVRFGKFAEMDDLPVSRLHYIGLTKDGTRRMGLAPLIDGATMREVRKQPHLYKKCQNLQETALSKGYDDITELNIMTTKSGKPFLVDGYYY